MLSGTIKSGRWFRFQPKDEEPSALGALFKTLIGLAFGGVAFVVGAQTLAVFIWTVAVLMGIVTWGSRSARTHVGRFFAALGTSIGWGLGILLLTPVYLFGFTLARLVGKIAGRDPLHLRESDAPTFWLPADQDRRKVRHIRSLFATETLGTAQGRGFVGLAALGALLITTEIVLRVLGFGNPILYSPDVRAGYYPGPDQEITRYGGKVATNRFGMRAPDFELEKTEGLLRVLMLGDSTLWGGSYVDQADIYARRLERTLNDQHKNKKVQVFNMGVNAWGPFNELGYVEQFGDFDADIAIICLPIGDIYRKHRDLTGLPYFTVDAPPRLALEEILRHLNWRSRQWGGGIPSTEQLQEQGERGIEVYLELATRLRDSGCEVLIEILPSRVSGTTGVTPEGEQLAVDKLRVRLEQKGFAVGFPAGLFQGQGKPSELYHDVCHLHTLGHEVYANYLEPRLREQCAVFRSWSGQSLVAAEEGTESR